MEKNDKKLEIKMIRKLFIILTLIAVILLPLHGQAQEKQKELKREVTLYNPYRPSLPDVKKKSYLPEINDTASVNPSFSYVVTSKPFSPSYSINPIKPASLLSDPLPKLYKSYVKAGLGNNNTPLAELSITNHRSKKGAIGFYAKHYSSDGRVPLENKQRVPAGFMDNDATLFGKVFFNKSILDISGNFMQRTRYAYGYNTEVTAYEPIKKDVKLNYYDAGAKVGFSSLNLDSADFSYDFSFGYDFFHNMTERTSNHTVFSGMMAKQFRGFYVGSDLKFDHYKLSDSLYLKPKYIFSINPFLRKSTNQWNFNLGLQLVLERNLTTGAKLHFYPDIDFGFSVVPEYMRFFVGLSGKLENNDPMSVITKNPYLVPDGSLFRVPNTDHSLIISAGLKGNNGIGGTYLASAIIFPDQRPSLIFKYCFPRYPFEDRKRESLYCCTR